MIISLQRGRAWRMVFPLNVKKLQVIFGNMELPRVLKEA